MKRFAFRLQRVLDIKGVIQKLRERELGVAYDRLRLEEEQQRSLYEQLRYYQGAMARQFEKPFSYRDIMVAYNHLHLIDRTITGQQDRITAAQANVNHCSNRLKKAYKEKRILDIYRDRCHQTYRQEFNRDEQSQIDESVSSRYAIAPGPLLAIQ